MKIKAKKSRTKTTAKRKNPSPEENPANRTRALNFIKSVAFNLDKSVDRSSRHLSMNELAEIASIMNDIQDAFRLAGLRLPTYKDEVVTNGPKVLYRGGNKNHYFD